MEDEKYQVNIPAQVKTRIELINGIGIKELISTTIVGIISIILNIPVYTITKNYIVCVIIFAIITGLTFICVMKDKNNISVASTICNIYKYLVGQKFYKYVIREEDINEDI